MGISGGGPARHPMVDTPLHTPVLLERTLELLALATTVDDARAIARRQSLDPVCPFFAMDGESAVLALPGDPLYPDAAAPTDPQGPTRFVFEQGRFVPRRVQRPSR